MRTRDIGLGLTLLLAAVVVPASGQEIQVSNVLVKILDELEVPAPESGSVVEMAVREGARVAEGDLLARIDDGQARSALARAQVELAIAKAKVAGDVTVRSAERALETAQSELRRAEDARSRLREVITEAELERLRLASDQARLTVEKARHELQLAALTQELKQVELEFAAQQVERRQVKAPFAGVVVQIHKPRGSWAEPGDKLLRLVRLDRLRVEGLLDARHLRPNLQGQPVTLAVELPGAKAAQFRGQLVFVSPEIDPFNKQVRVLADIDNPRLVLQPGLRGVLTLSGQGQPATK